MSRLGNEGISAATRHSVLCKSAKIVLPRPWSVALERERERDRREGKDRLSARLRSRRCHAMPLRSRCSRIRERGKPMMRAVGLELSSWSWEICLEAGISMLDRLRLGCHGTLLHSISSRECRSRRRKRCGCSVRCRGSTRTVRHRRSTLLVRSRQHHKLTIL